MQKSRGSGVFPIINLLFTRCELAINKATFYVYESCSMCLIPIYTYISFIVPRSTHSVNFYLLKGHDHTMGTRKKFTLTGCRKSLTMRQLLEEKTTKLSSLIRMYHNYLFSIVSFFQNHGKFSIIHFIKRHRFHMFRDIILSN